jgi:hypothetical protein
MKTAIVFILLVLCLSQTIAWNDGLWGRELRKRVKPKIDAETMKLAEEMINQQLYRGKGRKMQLQNDDRLREVEES